MSGQTSLRLAAFIGYAAFWLAVLFGYLRLDQHDVSDPVYQLIRGAALVLPALLLGYVVGRPRAVLAGLVFLLAAALPERQVFSGDAVDGVLLGDYSVSLGRALALIALTTPCVVAGIMLRAWTARAAASEPQPSE